MKKEEFIKIVKQKFPLVDESFFSSIEIYKKLLNEENTKYNLTRLNDELLVYEEYFYSSMLPFINIDFKNKKILDVGSGSGIPGVLIKLLEPSSSVYLVESNTKKCDFLNLLISKLNLKNIHVLNNRAEELEKSYRNFFDISTARAVAELKIIIELLAPYTKLNGSLILPKSKNVELEIQDAKTMIGELNLTIAKIQNISLSKDHNIVFLTKNKLTDNKYPRMWKEIIKDSK